MAVFCQRRWGFARQLVVAVSLACFLAATVGVPVVVTSRQGKQGSQPFPCMGHACGCRSAEACWQGCCCMTMAQKVAWAKRQGVTPPSFVVEAAKREQSVAKAGCCSVKQSQTCCSSSAAGCEDKEHERAASEPAVRLGFVLAVAARKCQGQAELWLALGAVSLPPAAITMDLNAVVCGEAVPRHVILYGTSHGPQTPPPRA